MAWTNVKEEALPRFNKLARVLGLKDWEVIGPVYFLWRNSQNILAEGGTREDIVEWMHFEGEPDAECERWLCALMRVRFLSNEGGWYRIHGNDVEIAKLIDLREKSAKGGAATKALWEKKRAAQAAGRPAGLAPGVPQVGPMQSKAKQCKQEEGAAASSSEKNSDLLPTERTRPVLDPEPVPETPDFDVFADVVRDDWLKSVCRLTQPAIDAWRAEYGAEKVRWGLGEAYADWCGDRDEFFAPLPGKFQSEKSRITQKLRRYVANAKAPPGGADVIPLSEEKAEKRVTYCGDCENGFRHVERGGYRFSEPCECVSDERRNGSAV